jgi:hypothetical protein
VLSEKKINMPNPGDDATKLPLPLQPIILQKKLKIKN